jgi:hypothetical protein
MTTKTKKCPYCASTTVVKNGTRGSVQRWKCTTCNKRFVRHKDRSKEIFIEYVFHKQTLRELSLSYNKDKRVLQKQLDTYVVPNKIHQPRAVYIMVDALRFGSRDTNNEWCIVVFRDNQTKENIWWGYSTSEDRAIYQTGKDVLLSFGYTILGVTGDGFSGIRSVFKGIPFQMCHVHMERLVVSGTTRNPLLEAGQVLLALTRSLHDPETTEDIFRKRILGYKEKYWSFLQEKSESLTTGERWFTHDGLRQGFNSLYSLFPHLFTYKQNVLLPRTTNSLEGHFSHVRDIVHIHRSLTRKRAERVLDAVMLVSTIAPTEEQIQSVFK